MSHMHVHENCLLKGYNVRSSLHTALSEVPTCLGAGADSVSSLSIEGVQCTFLLPPCTQPCLRFPPALVQELIQSAVSTLEHTWAWVVSVLDVAEGQLQQGQMFNTQVSLDILSIPNQNSPQSAMQFGCMSSDSEAD